MKICSIFSLSCIKNGKRKTNLSNFFSMFLYIPEKLSIKIQQLTARFYQNGPRHRILCFQGEFHAFYDLNEVFSFFRM